MNEDPKQPESPDEAPDEARDETAEVPATDDGEPVAEAGTDATAPPTPESRIAALEDRVRRQQAEFVNETKRIQRQADERGRYAVEGLISDLLPVFDALHSARNDFETRAESDRANETASAALEGFDLVEKELLNVLGRHGVSRIETDGQTFDPGLHHAILMLDVPDLPAGAVAKELRPGFLLNDRVVRPAHVAVVPPREAPPPEADEAAEAPNES